MSDQQTTLDNVLEGKTEDQEVNPITAENDDSFNAEAFIEENIGEGKKYADAGEALKALAKGKFHADNFIETLKVEVEAERREKAELESKLGDSKKIDDLLAAIESEEVHINAKPSSGGDDDSAQVDVGQIRTIVSELLDAEKNAAKEAKKAETLLANENAAFDMLSKPTSEGGFGSKENAALALQRYVGGDEARKDIIKRLAGNTPEAVAEFLKLQLKGDDAIKLDGVEGTTVRVQEDTSPNRGMLTWAQVQQVKKDNPKRYWSPKFQMQIHEAAAANPDFWKK